MTYVFIALGVFFTAKQLFLYFVAAMRLKMVRDAGALTKAQTIVGFSLVAEGLLIDLVFHLVVGTVLFLELPARKEWTLSARLWRLSNGPAGWRQRLAFKIRTQLLDSVDPAGVHRG